MSNRKFGIEIEFKSNLSRDDIAARIRAAGVTCYAEGYNHATRATWKLITDVSAGYELVSPPITRAEFGQIEVVCRVLAECGAKVDKTCGLHVHHDARDFTLNGLKNVAKLWLKLEGAMGKLVAPSRRAGNMYLKPNSTNKAAKVEAINKANSVSDLLHGFQSSDRYYAFNLMSYLRHGTAEVRLHGGTIEAEKIINWVTLTQNMVEKCATDRLMNIWVEDSVSVNHVIYFYGEGRKLATYFRKRAAHFGFDANEGHVTREARRAAA